MAVAYRTVKDLKLNTPAVLRATRWHDVVITLHGKPVAILRRFTPAELEATVLLQSKGLRARLHKALEQVRAGREVSLEQLVAASATTR
jgi:antitoxin (DNA-binding transcriptional repressor) of toxin-antitoxin stability system